MRNLVVSIPLRIRCLSRRLVSETGDCDSFGTMSSEAPGVAGIPWLGALGSRLLGFALLLVVLPTGILAVMTFSSARRALEESAGRQLATAAHEAAEHVGDPLEQDQRALRLWSRQEAIRNALAPAGLARAAEFMATIVDQDAAYLGIEIIDDAGVVITASDASLAKQSRAGEAWFLDALAGKQPVRGPVPDARGSGKVLHLATSLRGPNGTGSAVLHLALDWTRVEAQLARSRGDLASMGLETEIFLVDVSQVIGSSRRHFGDNRRAASLVAAAEAAVAGWNSRRPPGFVVAHAADVLLGISRPAGGRPDWGVVVAQPLDAALAPIARLQQRWAFVFGLILVAAVLVASVQAARMVRPLRQLTAVTRQVAETGRPMPAPEIRSEDEIGELASSFTRMSNRLEQARDDLVDATRLALVGELAAGVAHEVRTPLSVLRSSTQLLHRALPPGNGNADELAKLMLGEIDRLERLVAGLLELARPRLPARASTQLGEVLGRVAELVKSEADERGVRLVRSFAELEEPAFCDPDQIHQVALNLVMNALQHTAAGGFVEIRGIRVEDKVGFDVIDNGTGVDVAMRERVFMPFVTSRANGSGLGLALAKAIVEAHRGRITLERSGGDGTVFRVLLPIAEET